MFHIHRICLKQNITTPRFLLRQFYVLPSFVLNSGLRNNSSSAQQQFKNKDDQSEINRLKNKNTNSNKNIKPQDLNEYNAETNTNSDNTKSKTNQTNEENEKTQRNSKYENQEQKQLIVSGSFENINDKNRETYMKMVQIFEKKSVHRRNHVEFIYAALKNMESFGVHKDINVYRALMDIMPKGKFIPSNIFQAEFMHYPKQQQVIIDLLEQMEDNGIIPDYEMQDILVNTFGHRGHPVLKYWRMMYWMPKFKNASPWPLPNPIPLDSLELARLAIERMCTVDLKSKISIYQTNEIENSIDDTWIVSGQSSEQSKLLEMHRTDIPLHIEGPFKIWLRNESVDYFTLRGDREAGAGGDNGDHNNIKNVLPDDPDDVGNLSFDSFALKKFDHKSAIKKSIHIQDDGIIYGICATGTSTKDSLLSWIRLLERNNNDSLSKIPILFKFKAPHDSQLVKVKNS